MQELKDRIVKEGKILPGNIVKVDGFLNHRVDCAFMGRIADEFKKYFDLDNVDLYTYKKKVTLLVSKEWIHPGDRVLVIDDFLARGEALRGLCEIVQAAGAELVGIGCAVEKGFQGGGDKLRAAGVNLHSLAIIESAEPGHIVFREEA